MGTASARPTRFNAEHSTPLKTAGYMSGSQVMLAYNQNFELRNKPEFPPTSYSNDAYIGDDSNQTAETSWTVTQPELTCTVCSDVIEKDKINRYSFDGTNWLYLRTVCDQCFLASGEQERDCESDLEMDDPDFIQDFALSPDPESENTGMDSDSDSLSDNFFTQSAKGLRQDDDVSPIDSSPLFTAQEQVTGGRKTPPLIICNGCEEGNRARKQCNECGYICEECVDAHLKFRQLQRHIVTVVQELQPPALPPTSQESTTRHVCPNHPDFEVVLFCASAKCKIPICAMCTLEDHDKLQGHVHVKLNDAMDEAMSQIKKASVVLVEKKDKILTVKASIEEARMTLTKQFKTRNEELQKIARNLHQLIDQSYLTAATKLDQLHKTESKRLKDHQLSVQSVFEQINNTNDLIKDSSQHKDPVEVIEFSDKLQDCLLALESEEIPENNGARTSFQFTEDHHTAVCDIKQSVTHLFDFYEMAPAPSSEVIKSASLVRDGAPTKPSLNGNIAAMYEVNEGFTKMEQNHTSVEGCHGESKQLRHSADTSIAKDSKLSQSGKRAVLDTLDGDSSDEENARRSPANQPQVHQAIVHQKEAPSTLSVKGDVTALFDELHAELEHEEQALKEAAHVQVNEGNLSSLSSEPISKNNSDKSTDDAQNSGDSSIETVTAENVNDQKEVASHDKNHQNAKEKSDENEEGPANNNLEGNVVPQPDLDEASNSQPDKRVDSTPENEDEHERIEEVSENTNANTDLSNSHHVSNANNTEHTPQRDIARQSKDSGTKERPRKSRDHDYPPSQTVDGNSSTSYKGNGDFDREDQELTAQKECSKSSRDSQIDNSNYGLSQDSDKNMTNDNSIWGRHHEYSSSHPLNGNIAALYELNGNFLYSDSNTPDESPTHNLYASSPEDSHSRDLHMSSQSADSSQSSGLSYQQDEYGAPEDEDGYADWDYPEPPVTGIAALYELNDDSLLKKHRQDSLRSRSRSRNQSRDNSNSRSHSNSRSRHSSVASDNRSDDISFPDWNPHEDLHQNRNVTIFHGLDDGFLLRERQPQSPIENRPLRSSLSRNSSRSSDTSSRDANHSERSRSRSSSRSSAASFSGSLHSDLSRSSSRNSDASFKSGSHIQSNWSPTPSRRSDSGTRSITTCSLSESPPKTSNFRSSRISGKIEPRLCTASLDRNLRLNKPCKTVMRTYDTFGDPLRTSCDANIQVRLEYEDVGWQKADGQIVVYDHLDGSYTIQFTPCWYGNHRLAVSIDGIPIQDSPFLFWVPYCM